MRVIVYIKNNDTQYLIIKQNCKENRSLKILQELMAKIKLDTYISKYKSIQTIELLNVIYKVFLS